MIGYGTRVRRQEFSQESGLGNWIMCHSLRLEIKVGVIHVYGKFVNNLWVQLELFKFVVPRTSWWKYPEGDSLSVL